MTNLPPPRYQVVERDRRLSVVDRWAAGGRPGRSVGTAAGAGADSATATDPAPPSLTLRTRQVAFDGSAMLTTHRLYDDNGPRTIRLDGGSARAVAVARVAGPALFGLALLLMMAFAPWLIPLLAFGLVRSWRRLRTGATAWLDRVEREAS